MHGFRFAAIGVIPVAECHAVVIRGINPAVADRTVEYVTGEIGDSIARPVKCFLDMRDSVLVIKQAYGMVRLWLPRYFGRNF